ncbi:MAG: hypothetical protein ACXWQE_14785 [Bdellovibrionales bacterium]
MSRFIICLLFLTPMISSPALANPSTKIAFPKLPVIIYEILSLGNSLIIRRTSNRINKPESVIRRIVEPAQMELFRADLLEYCNRFWFDLKGWRKEKCEDAIHEELDKMLTSRGEIFTYEWHVGTYSIITNALESYYYYDKHPDSCSERLFRRSWTPLD